MTDPLNYQGSRMFPQSILDDLDRRLKALESASGSANMMQGADAQTLDDLSTLVVRLVRALRRVSPESDLPGKALGYLYRKDLAPAVLRGGKFGEFAVPPEQTSSKDGGPP